MTTQLEAMKMMVDAFDKGWIMAVHWAGEGHLLADMDSAAYKEERAAALAKVGADKGDKL